MAVKKGGLGKGLDSLIPSTGGPKNKKSNTILIIQGVLFIILIIGAAYAYLGIFNINLNGKESNQTFFRCKHKGCNVCYRTKSVPKMAYHSTFGL